MPFVLIAAFAAACAPKAAPVITGAPRHTDFMFPVPPQGTVPLQAARLDRGWQYLQFDDFQNAEREFDAALKQEATFYPAEAALAYLSMARGNEKDAATRFERALQIDPQYVPALVGRGRALLELDRPGEALASFEAALAKDPSLTDLKSRVDLLRLGSAQDLLGRAKSAADGRRWEEARAAYQQAIAASPDSAFLYRELAIVEQKAGQPTEALAHFRKAVELDAADARSLAGIGAILESQGDTLGALSAYERARAMDAAEVPESVINRLRASTALMKMPAEYRAIPGAPSATRADVAALIGVRLEALVAQAKPRPVIITDIRNHWAQPWIAPVVRSGIMDTLPNYEFEPSRPARRGELATAVSRILTIIAAAKPELAKKWQGARLTINDVPPGHLSYPAVSMVVAAGVMPLSGGNFDLLRAVSGADALEVIGRLEALARP